MICDTEMYGFILKAVELPLSRGSFVKMICVFYDLDPWEHTELATALSFFGAKTV